MMAMAVMAALVTIPAYEGAINSNREELAIIHVPVIILFLGGGGSDFCQAADFCQA